MVSTPAFTDKTVAVSGATGQLGSRIVDGFAAAGAKVVALIRNPRPDYPWHASNVRTIQCDVTSETSVVSSFRSLRSDGARLDVLVHAAGMWEQRPLEETSLGNWEQMMSVNLTSAFLCFREAIKCMEGGTGRLIGIASRQGADEGTAQQAGYSASKGGLVRLVEAVAAEYGPRITAHAIAPSIIRYEESGYDSGVHVNELVDLCLFVSSASGAALNGRTIRAYG